MATPVTFNAAGSIHIASGGIASQTSGSTLFTTASNQYAIFTLLTPSQAAVIGGTAVVAGTISANYYVGPSTTVAAGSGTTTVSYVIFQNT